MFPSVRLSILVVLSVGLLVPSLMLAATPPTALDSLNAVRTSLTEARTDQAAAQLQSLAERLAIDSSQASQDLVRQVQYVLLELAAGDLHGALSRLEALIGEAGSSASQPANSMASIASRLKDIGYQGVGARPFVNGFPSVVSLPSVHGHSGGHSNGGHRTTELDQPRGGSRTSSDSLTEADGTPNASGSRDFSIVALPDPQYYAAKLPKIGNAQTEWIRQNVKKRQIKFVVTMGDNVDAGHNDAQYKNSVQFMNKLNGVVPYGVACGNHDLKNPAKDDFTCRKFVHYYGPQRFKNRSWYGGASKSGFSSYQFFEGGGYSFIMLELVAAAPKDEVDWAKSVIAEHPDTPVILTTHQMLTPMSALGKTAAVKAPGRQTPQQVWGQLVKPCPQIFMVLCGHYHGEACITKKTQAPQPVPVVLQDYQKEPNGGDGWLRIFTFRPDTNRIDVQTYSPTLKKYNKGPLSQFSLVIDFKLLRTPVAAKSNLVPSRCEMSALRPQTPLTIHGCQPSRFAADVD